MEIGTYACACVPAGHVTEGWLFSRVYYKLISESEQSFSQSSGINLTADRVRCDYYHKQI